MTLPHGRPCRAGLTRYLPPAAWMGLIFILSAQSDLPHPESLWLDLLLSSVAHTVLFGVLAALWGQALVERPRGRLLAFALSALYAVSDELHQALVPGRHPDLLDLGCDVVGTSLGLALWAVWRRRRARAVEPGEGSDADGSS